LNNIVELKNVNMKFKLSSEKVDNLKEYVVKLVKKQVKVKEHWVLRDLNLSIKKGEVLGILGINGCGKSTLLKVIAGVLKPTSGEVEVTGKIAPLIELGAGFDMDLTGRENIFLNGAILGYSKEFMLSHYDEIVEFAEIAPFIDMPLKNYSSGMIARLGFAIATAINPEILIVDEVLSVGDFQFKDKSKNKIKEIIEQGTTVLFVSHSADEISEICDRVIWLKDGCIQRDGDVNEILNEYISCYTTKR